MGSIRDIYRDRHCGGLFYCGSFVDGCLRRFASHSAHRFVDIFTDLIHAKARRRKARWEDWACIDLKLITKYGNADLTDHYVNRILSRIWVDRVI